jgi:tetratricopeptide (TPR) repeat protein
VNEWSPHATAGEDAAAQGRYAAARDAFTEALRIARAEGAPAVVQARCARQAGGMLRELAEYDGALDTCSLAVALTATLQDDEARSERIRALTELGLTLVATGRHDEARHPLEEALRSATPESDADAAWALRALAEVRIAQARYADAEEVSARALAALVRHLGRRHPRTAHATNTWGIPALRLSHLDDADRRMRDALQLRRELLPPTHPHIAESLHNVAAVALARARLDEAEALETQAAQLWEQSLGADHPTVATALGNLGAIAGKRGQNARAEAFYRRGLEIREARLGPNHPRLAVSVNNLASVLGKLGRNAEAEEMFRRSLVIAETAHGPVHPSVARALNNLYGSLRAQDRGEEAEAYLARAIEVWDQCLPESRELAVSLSNLAVLQRARGEVEEAESTLLRVLGVTQRLVGPDHPDLATPLNNLADLYVADGRDQQAEELFLRAVRLRDQAGYRPAPEMLSNLAVIARRQGRLDEAAGWMERAIGEVEADLGPGNLRLVPLLWQMAGIQRHQDDHDGAAVTLQRALAVQEGALGATHPDLAATLTALGGALDAGGRREEAEAAYRRGVALLDDGGPDAASGRLAELLVLLGHNLAETGRPTEALPILRRALDLCRDVLGTEHGLTATALTWLGYAELAAGETEAATEHLHAALEVRDAQEGDGIAGTTLALHGLLRAYRSGGLPDELADVLARLVALRSAAGTPDRQFDRLIRELADLRMQATRYGDAAPLYRRVLAVSDEVGRHPMFVATTCFSLGVCLAHLGAELDADAAFLRAESHVREASGEHDVDLLHCLATHVDFRRSCGRLEGALELAAELGTLLVRDDLGSESIARGQDSLGRLYAACGRWADADSAFRASQAGWEASAEPGASGSAVTARYELARLTHVRGMAEEAERAYAALQAELEQMGTSAGPALIRVLEDHARLLSEGGRGDEAARLLAQAEQVAARLG